MERIPGRSIMLAQTRMGPCGLGFMGGSVGRLWLPGGDEALLADDMGAWAGVGVETHLKTDVERLKLAEKIARYFDGERVDFDSVNVTLPGFTAFGRNVLERLRMVKWGSFVTYKELAAMAGRPGASRAIGMIMSKNPIPLIIPCHRVIRADGGLGGFSGPGGVALKKTMLRLEGFSGKRAAYDDGVENREPVLLF